MAFKAFKSTQYTVVGAATVPIMPPCPVLSPAVEQRYSAGFFRQSSPTLLVGEPLGLLTWHTRCLFALSLSHHEERYVRPTTTTISDRTALSVGGLATLSRSFVTAKLASPTPIRFRRTTSHLTCFAARLAGPPVGRPPKSPAHPLTALTRRTAWP